VSKGRVAKRAKSYILRWLIAMISLTMCIPWANAQSAESESLPDTSYFKSGNDNWNLVESVIRTDPANVLFLLNRGADPNAKAEGGMTALMFSAEKGDTILIKLLVLNGADLELTHIENTTPLMVAVLNSQFDAAHLLLRMGADPNYLDEYGGSSLQYSAAMNNYMMADLLLFFGALHETRDKKGDNPLMTAVYLGFMETSHVLLQNGSAPDTRDKQMRTPLMVAAQQGNLEMISLLLEYRAGINLTDTLNYTPLTHATRTGQIETAKLLVDSGANVNHAIGSNQNVYDLALRYQQKEIGQLLKSKGARPTPRPNFTEFDLGWGNSFANGEHMMQVRLWWQDMKYGFFVETGYDFRPTLRTVQVDVTDTLVHQYRENRSAWAHGVGKFFTMARDKSSIEYGFYAGLHGLLSFASYRGIGDRPPPTYHLVPSAGVFMRGKIAGLKAGTERYTFGTIHESPWKINITLFVRMPYKNRNYEIKEITF
jgi:ankyrin repeat protein